MPLHIEQAKKIVRNMAELCAGALDDLNNGEDMESAVNYLGSEFAALCRALGFRKNPGVDGWSQG
jgi:hypothetical protein